MLQPESSKSERIRVLRIIARMNVGGPAVQVSGLMRHLDNSKFDQRLLTGFCDLGEADYLDTAALDISAQRIDGLGRSLSLWNDWKAFTAIRSEIRTFKPHIIHTHTAKAGVLGRLASLSSGMSSKRVHTFHGHLLNGYFSRPVRRLVILIERLLAYSTDVLVSVGVRVRNELIAVGIGSSNKFRVVPPGLELNEVPSRIAARKLLELSEDDFVVSFMGRITQIKRPDRFLDAIDAAKHDIPELKCLIAGEGDLYQVTKDRAAELGLPVIFLGWRSDIEVILAASDVVMLTSDNEGTPLSLIQAGMIGVPAIATRVGSVEEIVKDLQGGLLVERSSYELALALVSLFRDRSILQSYGSFAMEWMNENYSVERLVADHEAIYRSLR